MGAEDHISDDQPDYGEGTLFAEATSESAGQRLDRFLADTWPHLSRARIAALIRAGDVGSVAAVGRTLNPSGKVREGDRFHAVLPEPTPAKPEAQAIPLDVVFEDDNLLVINKPAGMTVHPAPGQAIGTLVNALLAHCGDSLSGIGGVRRPGIVHRIDKETSGLLVVAKHDAAHQGLARQFEAHSVERAYQALVWGLPSPAIGRIEGDIGRDPKDRKRMAVVRLGKHAVTHYAVIQAFGVAASEIECRLETGRTHQIRVHMAKHGFPLIGDQLYGRATAARKARLGETARGAATAFRRQALHAGRLGFDHPIDHVSLSFTRPPPEDYQRLHQALTTGAETRPTA